MTNKTTRRDFINSTVLAAGGALIASRGLASSTVKGLEPSVQRRLSIYDQSVRQLLGTMTLDEKIGQMTQAEQSALVEVSDIEKYFWVHS